MVQTVLRIFRHNNPNSTAPLISALVAVLLALQGCARLSIPAPDEPIRPLTEQAVPDSVISLPISFSVSSVMNSLGLSPGMDDPERDKRIAGKIRGFLQRQTNKKENLAQNPFLQQQVGKAWDSLQKPVQLNNGWQLFIRPQTVSLTPVAEDGETVRVIAGLVARPVLVSGGVAPAPQPLPSFSVSSAPTHSGFHVALRTELSFTELGNELTKRLKRRSFSREGNTVVVDGVRAYGSGNSVVVAADVSGSLQGTVYLSGRPDYDPDTRSLTLAGVDYTIETTQVLVKTADWLRHSGLRENLAKKTTWFAGDRIDQARTDLEQALNRSVNDQVSMSGTVKSVRPIAVGLTQTGLAAILEADGTIEMHVH